MVVSVQAVERLPRLVAVWPRQSENMYKLGHETSTAGKVDDRMGNMAAWRRTAWPDAPCRRSPRPDHTCAIV